MDQMRIQLLLLITLVWASAFAQSDKDLAEQSVNQGIIKSHIGFLASDELRGRDTGSPELKIAAQYIKSRFLEYGVGMAPGMETFFQKVPMKKVAPPSKGTINVGTTELKINDDFIVLEGDAAIVDQAFFYADYGMPKDLNKKQVEGKVVFALCGDGVSQSPQEWFTMSSEKRKKVKELGGIALIELYNSPQIPWNFLVRYQSREQMLVDLGDGDAALPHVWLNRSADDVSFLDDKKKKISVSIAAERAERFVSQNVIGYIEGNDQDLKDEIVVYSAHYDHVGIGVPDATGDSIYNGSRDNAVGTVTVLTAAQNLAKNPTRRSALFVLFTAEEKGLLGSQFFVDNSPVDLKSIVYCFNSDNGGYNDTSKATIIGLTRTSAEQMIVDACKAFGLEAIEDPAKEQGLFDRSDNVRFAVKGIPAPTFSMGFTAFDAEITKYYHQAGDGPETLDYPYLEKFFKSYVYSCRLIGNADKAPFWLEGDKYYEAGMQLYK